MPEGPEVRTVTDQLAPILEAASLVHVEIVGGRYEKTPPKGLQEILAALKQAPLAVEEVNCKGKFIYFRLADEWSIWNTLGMTGTWSSEHRKHATLRFEFELQIPALPKPMYFSLYFVDTRRFGTVKFVKSAAELQKKLKGLGVDMLQVEPSFDDFLKLLKKRPQWEVTKALMNQANFAGVGNYIKADALYLARISPKRTCDSLTHDEVERLRVAILDVMLTSYASGGNTIKDYRSITGEEGKYRRHCYGRKTDRHGNPIISEDTQDGRTTWWCPNMQV